MNILHNSNFTKVMGSTLGGDAVGQARGRTGSKGGRSTQHMVGRPSVESVHEETWRGHRVGAEEACTDLSEIVAWDLLLGRPHVAHLALLVLTSVRASLYSSYKYPHPLHSENQIKVHVSSFQVLPLPYFIE
jgi:hypothetical protein